MGHASEELRADGDSILACLLQSKNGQALQYASEQLQGDHQCVLEVAKTTVEAVQFTREELHGDHDVMLKAAVIDAAALKHASEELRADDDFIRAALLQSLASGAAITGRTRNGGGSLVGTSLPQAYQLLSAL